MSAILAAILDFWKIYILYKTAANCMEIGRKHMFTASNTNIIKNRMEKKNF